MFPFADHFMQYRYQWVDCQNNYTDLPNDTNQVFYPGSNGEYAVIITYPNGCSYTSACYVFIKLSVIDRAFNNSILIYPNPFSQFTTIVFTEVQKNTSIKLTNMNGEELKTIKFSGKELQIEKGDLSDGMYFIKIINEQKQVAIKKIMIQ